MPINIVFDKFFSNLNKQKCNVTEELLGMKDHFLCL